MRELRFALKKSVEVTLICAHDPHGEPLTIDF
jgi:hypothetical protein